MTRVQIPSTPQCHNRGKGAPYWGVSFSWVCPLVGGDGIPDIWTLTSDHSVKVYAGGAKSLGSGTEVISSASGWEAKLAFG